MSVIKLLDKNTIDKIAAGEVVDRPASIVKELIENSIDAGSTAISVEIRDGGKSLIRITDNGSGIARDQIALAFLRHSTSKINDASDLSFIHTLGFRGEALSSIAAVSQTELCTKTREDLTGIIYKINGGSEESLSEAGLPDGTTIIVRNLFYNTPARLKFLKSDQTEAGYIMDIVQKIALSRPDISFKYTANGSVRLNTSGNNNLKDAIYSIFGRDITANLLDLNVSDDIVKVEGFIGKPEIARGNRNFEYFFINGRYIKDRIIQKALEDAYIGYQMKGTFPFAVFNVTIEPELVDVNVHPSKMEIRFFNNETIYNSIYEIIRNRITKRESIPDVILNEINEEKSISHTGKIYVPEPFETKSRDIVKNISEDTVYNNKRYEPDTNIKSFYQEKSSFYDKKENADTVKKSFESLDKILNDDFNKKESEKLPSSEGEYQQKSFLDNFFLSKEARPEHRIVGEVFNTYWIVEYDNKLFIIDQHAAHEKVLFERFMKKIRSETHFSQKIMPSIIVTLSSQEENVFSRYKSSIEKLGFEVENFGGSEYSISAVPTDLYSVDNKVLFMELLSDLEDVSVKSGPDIISERVATAACKAAVKGGNKLSMTEANALIDELLSLDNPYNCPHGRPTIVSMTKYELEKKFKRII